jgi:putative sporulation protein YyaC
MIDIFCIGNPRVPFDSVGPAVGSLLTWYSLPQGVSVLGTLRDPIVDTSFNRYYKKLRRDAVVVCVDASIFRNDPSTPLYSWQVSDRPIRAGEVIGFRAPAVGDVAYRINMGESVDQAMECTEEHAYRIAQRVSAAILHWVWNQ